MEAGGTCFPVKIKPVGVLPRIGPVVVNTVIAITRVVVECQALEQRCFDNIVITLPPDMLMADTTRRLVHVHIVQYDPVRAITRLDQVVAVAGHDRLCIGSTDYVISAVSAVKIAHVALGANNRYPAGVGLRRQGETAEGIVPERVHSIRVQRDGIASSISDGGVAILETERQRVQVDICRETNFTHDLRVKMIVDIDGVLAVPGEKSKGVIAPAIGIHRVTTGAWLEHIIPAGGIESAVHQI